MTYKLLRTNEDGIKIYGRIDDDGIMRTSCLEFDQAYLKWVEEGNTPLPADEGTA
jgi:hypothetical protein